MAIKISGGNYFSGMPSLDYTIEINGVSISLNTNDFVELQKAINKKSKSDFEKAVEVKENYMKNVERMRKLRDAVIDIFYERTKDSDFLWTVEPSDIKEQKINLFINEFKGDLYIE